MTLGRGVDTGLPSVRQIATGSKDGVGSDAGVRCVVRRALRFSASLVPTERDYRASLAGTRKP